VRSRTGSENTLLCRSEAIVTRGDPSIGIRFAGLTTRRASPTSCASSSWSSAWPERRTVETASSARGMSAPKA
jgi:hypothetical protein